MVKKLIVVTQREIKESDEIRDSLDRGWLDFFEKCDLIPLLIPNKISLAKNILSKIAIDGILLTGGGDIKSCGGKDWAREEVEDYLIKLSVKKKIPLLGICRGMQKIQDVFGIKIGKVSGHISKKQKIRINGKLSEVNSFHNFGATQNNDQEFSVFAIAKDGVIKGIKHKKNEISAIMWHPERIKPFRAQDIKFFGEAFK